MPKVLQGAKYINMSQKYIQAWCIKSKTTYDEVSQIEYEQNSMIVGKHEDLSQK